MVNLYLDTVIAPNILIPELKAKHKVFHSLPLRAPKQEESEQKRNFLRPSPVYSLLHLAEFATEGLKIYAENAYETARRGFWNVTA